MPDLPAVPMEEAVALLQRVARREQPVALVDPDWTWLRAFCAPVAFRSGGYVIEFFNDCGELDYLEEITAPDGRSADYDEYAAAYGGNDPVSMLGADDLAALQDVLAACGGEHAEEEGEA